MKIYEDEYRHLISLLRNSPKELETIVRIFEIKKDKILMSMSACKDKDELWDVRNKLSFIEEFKREIIHHSKAE